MIASVQYNDLRGTAAADVADEYMNSLQKYLMDTFREYDPERYYCRGCTKHLIDTHKVTHASSAYAAIVPLVSLKGIQSLRSSLQE